MFYLFFTSIETHIHSKAICVVYDRSNVKGQNRNLTNESNCIPIASGIVHSKIKYVLLFSRYNIIYRLQITILYAKRGTRLKRIFSCEKSIYAIIAITKLVHIFFPRCQHRFSWCGHLWCVHLWQFSFIHNSREHQLIHHNRNWHCSIKNDYNGDNLPIFFLFVILRLY